MKVKYPHADELELLFTDTDSLGYAVQTDSIYVDMAEDADSKYDFSEYPADHPLYNTTNKKALGYFKDELNSVPLEVFVGLRPKCYAMLCTGKVDKNILQYTNVIEKKTAKGVKRKVKDDHLHFQHYLDAFRNFHSFICKQNLISSTAHTVRSIHQRKIGLTAFDTKRWLCEDLVHTHSYGHHRTVDFPSDLKNESFITSTIAEAIKRLKSE